MPSRPSRRLPKITPPKSKRWMPAPIPGGGDRVCRVRITLCDTGPWIWRQLLLPAEIRLSLLHDLIQVAMGWQNAHMHQFIMGARDVLFRDAGSLEDGGFSFAEGSGPQFVDEAKVRLDQVLPEAGDAFGYEYDFGDGWEHAIELEEFSPRPADFKGPVCLAGERACPPEDCGGVPGFADLLCLLKSSPKKDDEEDAHRREWLGDFDPAQFDLAAVNRILRRRMKC